MQEGEDIVVARSGAADSRCRDKEASVVVGCCVLVRGVWAESGQFKDTGVVGALVDIDGVLRVLPAGIVIADTIVRRLASISVTHAQGMFRCTRLSNQELSTILGDMAKTHKGKIVRRMEQGSTVDHISHHGHESDIGQEGYGRPEERARAWQAGQKAAKDLGIFLFEHNGFLDLNFLEWFSSLGVNEQLVDLGIDKQLIVTVVAINGISSDDVKLIGDNFVRACVSELIEE
jgi:hypothetical protein